MTVQRKCAKCVIVRVNRGLHVAIAAF